jgi:hypothetical protein
MATIINVPVNLDEAVAEARLHLNNAGASLDAGRTIWAVSGLISAITVRHGMGVLLKHIEHHNPVRERIELLYAEAGKFLDQYFERYQLAVIVHGDAAGAVKAIAQPKPGAKPKPGVFKHIPARARGPKAHVSRGPKLNQHQVAYIKYLLQHKPDGVSMTRWYEEIGIEYHVTADTVRNIDKNLYHKTVGAYVPKPGESGRPSDAAPNGDAVSENTPNSAA